MNNDVNNKERFAKENCKEKNSRNSIWLLRALIKLEFLIYLENALKLCVKVHTGILFFRIL